MTNNEIFTHIASDIADVGNGMFGVRGITIWMTKDLFNHLCPEQFVLQKDNITIKLFGCKIRVVIFPCDGMQWIVGYEGKVEDGE